MSTDKKILEHKFFILDTESRNKNHRLYTMDVVGKWNEDERLEEEGIDLEYAVGDEKIDTEYLQEHLNCGTISSFEIDGTKLYANVRFKINDHTKKIYSKEVSLDDLRVVPKGKGSVKNQKVQDDYELYGFNLVMKSESSFEKEEETEKN